MEKKQVEAMKAAAQEKEFSMEAAVEKIHDALDAIMENLDKDKDEVSYVSAHRASMHVDDIIKNIGKTNKKVI